MSKTNERRWRKKVIWVKENKDSSKRLLGLTSCPLKIEQKLFHSKWILFNAYCKYVDIHIRSFCSHFTFSTRFNKKIIIIIPFSNEIFLSFSVYLFAIVFSFFSFCFVLRKKKIKGEMEFSQFKKCVCVCSWDIFSIFISRAMTKDRC